MVAVFITSCYADALFKILKKKLKNPEVLQDIWWGSCCHSLSGQLGIPRSAQLSAVIKEGNHCNET